MNLIDILFIPINKIKKTIGSANDTGGSSSAGTVMGKLNNIINNSTSSIIGNTTDTGGTETAGTVYAKLNALITKDKHKSFKYLETSFGVNQTDVTVLSITGAGEFYGIYGILSNVKVIIDGVEFDVNGSNDNRVYRANLQGSIISSFNTTPSSFYTYMIDSMPFKESLVIKISSNATYSVNVKITYSLYE